MMTNPTGRVTQGQFSFLPDLTDAEIAAQIEYGLAKGYAWSVEYTDDPHPRNTYWEMYGMPMFDLKDAAGVMLELAATLSSASVDGEKLPQFVVNMARKLICSDRCALFLVDAANQELEAYLGDTKVRMPINAGIAGHVATTGDTVNIEDAYRFVDMLVYLYTPMPM